MEKLVPILPILSLAIAALAIFFGPLVQLHIAKRQIQNMVNLTKIQLQNSLNVANRQVISPMRQKWIDDLRSLIVDLINSAQAHWIYPKKDTEPDHEALRIELGRLSEAVLTRKEDRLPGDYTRALSKATTLAQSVLRREWKRVSKENNTEITE